MRQIDVSGPARGRAAAAAIALALLAALLAFGPAPASRADSTDDDIKAMRELEAAGKADECLAKMDVVKAGRDPRAFAALNGLLSSKHDAIACGAIRALAGTWRDGDTFRWLVGKVEDKSFSDPKVGRPEVYKCVLEALRSYPPERIKQALKQLGDAVTRFMATDPEYADRAIRAYGCVPDRFTVQQLLAGLDQASAAATGAAKTNKDRAKKALLETLTALTGKELPDATEWKQWWGENGKTFKFPEPPKQDASGRPAAAPKPAAAAADPSKLEEFTDEAYGWSVKRPEGEDWTFFRPDYDGPRVGLRCGGDSENRARAYFCVHDPSRDPKDVKAFAQWVIDGAFKEQLPPENRFGDAQTRTMTIGGAEWTVVTGRGLAAGPKEFWGSMERRFYVTKHGSYLVYVDAFVRLGTDAEDKEALWKCIESITLTAKK